MVQAGSNSEGPFSFEHVFLAEVTNQTRHPRATLPELRAILRPDDVSAHQPDNHVGHWWEAQLLHYGLKPSKAKAVAKQRLLEALNAGSLAVPEETTMLEAKLKRARTKQGKEKNSLKPEGKAAGQAGKRKASADEGNLTPAKKAKKADTTAPKATTTPKAQATKATKTTKATGESKTTSKASDAKPKKATPKASTSKTQAAAKGKAKPAATASKTGKTTTAKRSVKNKDGLPVAAAAGTDPVRKQARTKQTARKSVVSTELSDETFNALYGFSRSDYSSRPSRSSEDVSDDLDHSEDDDDDDDLDSSDNSVSQFEVIGPLGLLNGTYTVQSRDFEGYSCGYNNFSLILTLDGSAIWGAFEFGGWEGILYMAERPYKASDEKYPFQWRGRETGEGEMTFDDTNAGWIVFQGAGHIAGTINCCGEMSFRGARVSGNQTGSDRSAESMKDEYYSYNWRTYEAARVARW